MLQRPVGCTLVAVAALVLDMWFRITAWGEASANSCIDPCVKTTLLSPFVSAVIVSYLFSFFFASAIYLCMCSLCRRADTSRALHTHCSHPRIASSSTTRVNTGCVSLSKDLKQSPFYAAVFRNEPLRGGGDICFNFTVYSVFQSVIFRCGGVGGGQICLCCVIIKFISAAETVM